MRRAILVVVCALLLPLAAVAQEEEPERSFVYGTYMECDMAKQWLADDIVEKYYKPVYDAAVEDGTIQAWGWLSHHTGGNWRRLVYTSASSMQAVLDGQATIRERIQAASPQAASMIAELCPAHDDYVWRSVTGTAPNAPRADFGLSVYFVCDMADEERADEIVEKHIGPIYDRHVGEGKLTSWGYMEHVLGGEYRRIATMTAQDLPTLIKTRGEILEAMQSIRDQAMEFSEICESHTDYVWMITHEKP